MEKLANASTGLKFEQLILGVAEDSKKDIRLILSRWTIWKVNVVQTSRIAKWLKVVPIKSYGQNAQAL